MIKHTEEFKQEAVRIALTSGLSRRRMAEDLGEWLSTLGKCVSQYRTSDLVSAPQADSVRENERLRLENRVLNEEINRRQAEAAIFQYINGFYNTRRRHSYLGGISPLAFEGKVA